VPWFSPPQRGVLPLDRLHVSHSLARRLRQSGYETTVDEAFAAVVEGCREPIPCAIRRRFAPIPEDLAEALSTGRRRLEGRVGVLERLSPVPG